MFYQFVILILFVNIVLSLRCKTTLSSNCIYNSTCLYNTTECKTSSYIRGGNYCTTIIKYENDAIIIGTMDCIYDQETTKICKNQSQCIMKYTNKDRHFLHCCCDEDFCNFNFNLKNLSENDLTIPSSIQCKHLLCESINIIILCIIITFIGLLLIILFILRKKIFQLLNRFCGFQQKSSLRNSNDLNENDPFLSKDEKKISSNEIIIEKCIKKGRFSSIYQGIYNNNHVAIKTYSDNEENEHLFEHEKQIYCLPFMTHFNILTYYGYLNNKSIVTELSKYGSLRDVLRSRLLKDENELLLICKQISEGIEYLHHDNRSQYPLSRPPIAHRDFKSENILYLNENKLVICDFAMSIKLDQNQNGPNQLQQIGTPRYMSPEILVGTIGCDTTALLKCDVYALGIIFWEILSRYPFPDFNEKYEMPFEKQLIEYKLNVNNPGIDDMKKIMDLLNPLNRPLINSLWEKFNFKYLNEIISTMKQCWDQEPDGRPNAASVAERMRLLTN